MAGPPIEPSQPCRFQPSRKVTSTVLEQVCAFSVPPGVSGEIALTHPIRWTSLKLKNSPVKLSLPKYADVHGKFFWLPFLLICLVANFTPASAAEYPSNSAGNYPSIYVGIPDPAVTNGLGYWIWNKVTLNKQTVRFWKGFEVPKWNTVVGGELRVAADNAFKVWLDGQEIGSGSDWRTLSIYELVGKLSSGKHVLAVEGFNDNDQAGLILGLSLKMADGKVMQIASDTTWRIAPNSDDHWETALRPDADWPNASFARNFGRMPWWSIPTSVLHMREALAKPVPFWQSRDFQFALFAGCGVFILICLYLVIQLVSQSKAHQLLQTERDRIARDIHDDLGSKLTQLLLTGEVAQIESAPPNYTLLSQMCDGARNILATIDEVVWIINSQHDNLEDFVIYVCKWAQNFLEPSSIRCRFDMPQELPPKILSELTRRNLFLAIKEAINNAVKHSGAAELTLHIELNGSQLSIIVSDDGRGFDSTQAIRERNGLTNMKQRMAEVGGDCEVISQPGHGCRVSFEVPLKQPSIFKSLFRLRNPDQSKVGCPNHSQGVRSPAKTLIKFPPAKSVSKL